MIQFQIELLYSRIPPIRSLATLSLYHLCLERTCHVQSYISAFSHVIGHIIKVHKEVIMEEETFDVSSNPKAEGHLPVAGEIAVEDDQVPDDALDV